MLYTSKVNVIFFMPDFHKNIALHHGIKFDKAVL